MIWYNKEGCFVMSEFSNRFKQLKDESNLTLKDLSEVLDITIPNLSYYMKGREPAYDILIRIANYFNVSVDWIIGNDIDISKMEDKVMKLEKENLALSKKLCKIKEMVLKD